MSCYIFDDDYNNREDYPDLIHEEIVLLDGLLYLVSVEQFPDGHIEVTHEVLEYTCWDGTIPF